MNVEEIAPQQHYRVDGVEVTIADHRDPYCHGCRTTLCDHIRAAREHGVRQWAETRPPAVREKVLAYPPTKRYLLKTTAQIVHIGSYSQDPETGECETCTIVVKRSENPESRVWDHPKFIDAQEHGVFGIKFSDLEALE